MRTVILASMRTYARRYVAALLAVVIATGFIIAINALSAAARAGSREAVDQQYGRADVALTSTGDPATAAADLRDVARDPAVTAVATDWQAYTAVTFPHGAQDVSIGSIATDPALRWQTATAGRLPDAGDEIALSTTRARDEGVVPGDSVSVDVDGDGGTFTVTGTVDADDGLLSASAYLPERTFSTLTSIAFPVDSVLAVDGDPASVASRLDATTGDAYRQDLLLQATRGIDIFQKLIYVFAGISLFVGALVIANTFTILLAQRSRDLALLRCVGALRSQVARSVVLEGIAIGAIGSGLGVVLGLGIALAGAALVGHFSPGVPMGTPSLTAAGVAIPAVLGILVTAGGAYLPAQRAGAQSPLVALQPQDVVELRTRAGVVRIVAAVTLLAVGALGLFAGLGGSLPAGMAGGMLSFVGVLLLTPVLVPAAIRAVGPAARRLGVAGRLAHLNALRNPRRTAATSTALLVGVTLITSVVVGSASISHKVNTSLDVNNPIDLIATASSGRVPAATVDQIDHVDGVSSAVALPATRARISGQATTVLTADGAALATVHGTPDFADLGRDQIVLSAYSDLVPADGTSDSVRVTIDGRTRTMHVLFADGIGGAPLISPETLRSMGGSTDGVGAVWVRATTDADPREVFAGVSSIAASSDLDVTGGLPDRADIVKTLDVVLAVTLGLLAVAILIALIGVGSTLSLSVLERVRENSLLRALGLSRSELRAMLAAEALLMAGVSAVLGVTLGTTYAWFGIRTTSLGVFTHSPTLTMPWGQIVLILVVAALAGLAACVLPARRAARIAPAAGLVAD